jgi:hypothetical protein
VREKEQLAEHGVLQTINEGDAIADRDDGADIIAFDLVLRNL